MAAPSMPASIRALRSVVGCPRSASITCISRMRGLTLIGRSGKHRCADRRRNDACRPPARIAAEDVRKAVSDRTSPRVGALVRGVVVVLDVASDFAASEKNMDRQCDSCDRRNDRHAKRNRRQEIGRQADSQHQQKDCADADHDAVTDYPPLKGSRFGIPTAKVPRSLRQGHRWRRSRPRPP